MSLRLLALTVVGMLLAGCGARVDTAAPEQDAAAGYPVTITNCGQQRTIERKPQRAVAYDTGIVELMFAMGLAQQMAGYVVSDGQQRGVASSPWKQQFREVKRLPAQRPTLELMLRADADFVFAGWNYGYSETTDLNPNRLREKGIKPYVLSESCRSGTGSQRGTMPPLQALYHDITMLGKIFNRQQRAAELVSRYRETVHGAQRSSSADDPRVFLYDSGTKEPFTSGRFGAAHAIVDKAGGRNIFTDLADTWTTVSWEAVVRRDPELILINDYGTPSASAKIDFLRNYPPLADVTAIRENRFAVLPYAALVEGPRNPSAISDLADRLTR